jgi:hypothetical protein
MDVWDEQEALARHVGRWGIGSLVLGWVLAAVGHARGDVRLRAFGVQNAGWGLVDLAVVVLVRRLTRRQLVETEDPHGPAAQRRQRRKLMGQLLLNAGLDAGYVWYGVRRFRRAAARSSAQGHASAIVAQGAFLFAADSGHAARLQLRD